MSNKATGYAKCPPVVRTWEDFGVKNRTDALELALRTMIEGYDRLIQIMPAGSQAQRLAQGSFGKAPEVSRMVLEKRG